MVGQVLKFSQADVNQLLKEKEMELEARVLVKEREWISKVDEQKRKCAELSVEKLQSDEKVIRLQKSHEDMKYITLFICLRPLLITITRPVLL